MLYHTICKAQVNNSKAMMDLLFNLVHWPLNVDFYWFRIKLVKGQDQSDLSVAAGGIAVFQTDNTSCLQMCSVLTHIKCW